MHHQFSNVVNNLNLCAAANVEKTISTGVDVLGVTSVDDELFVLLRCADNQVAVYSINDYQLLRHLSLPKFKPDGLNDITSMSCVRYKCLYLSDNNNKCIHRHDLDSSATDKWAVSDKPCGLSITPSGNLLVTCQSKAKLVEFADSGERLREIILQKDIECPRHGLQLTTGKFVVCHGESTVHVVGVFSCDRVCIVGDDGNALCSFYGGERGSKVGRLEYPRHLAVDKDSQFMFVVYKLNRGVMLLSPTLDRVRHVVEGLTDPRRLYFHQTTRRLFVGQVSGDVTVIQL